MSSTTNFVGFSSLEMQLCDGLTHGCCLSLFDLDDLAAAEVDWLQSLKQFFINVSYHILVVSLFLMALF